MKRYYLELNGSFVKDAQSLKTIRAHYEVYSRKFANSVLRIYDNEKGMYI